MDALVRDKLILATTAAVVDIAEDVAELASAVERLAARPRPDLDALADTVAARLLPQIQATVGAAARRAATRSNIKRPKP
jgi:hypothetical protein